MDREAAGGHSLAELEGALKAILSLKSKCEKAAPKLRQGGAQRSLIDRRISALAIAQALIEREIDDQGGRA